MVVSTISIALPSIKILAMEAKMICANTMALNRYERQVDRGEKIGAMFYCEMEEISKQIRELTQEAKSLVRHYEDEFCFDFSEQMREDLEDAING